MKNKHILSYCMRISRYLQCKPSNELLVDAKISRIKLFTLDKICIFIMTSFGTSVVNFFSVRIIVKSLAFFLLKNRTRKMRAFQTNFYTLPG